MLPQAGTDESEFELDFEALDETTLLRIDAWLKTLGKGGASPPAASHNPSVRLDPDTSESESEPNSDSD